MATPAWLRPLNSQKKSDLHVRIRESSQAEHLHTQGKLRMVATVDVVFYSNDGAARIRTAFRGLSIWKAEVVNVSNGETLAASLRRNFLDDEGLIPFPLGPCSWTEDHYGGGDSPAIHLARENDLVRRISDFVFAAEKKRVEARLEVTKLVAVAAGEDFAAWVSWYEEKRRLYRNFAVEYVRDATRRPATAKETVEDEESSNCLDEFGGGGVAELLGAHRYHQVCIQIEIHG